MFLFGLFNRLSNNCFIRKTAVFQVANGLASVLQSLAKAIATLADNPSRWAEFGRAGRAHVAAHYDSGKLLTDQIGLYDQLLDEVA